MTESLADAVRLRVEAVSDPELRRSLGELGMIASVGVDNAIATVTVSLTITGCPAADRIRAEVREAAESVTGISRADVTLEVMSDAQRAEMLARIRPGGLRPAFGSDSPTRVIAITSGKGGVGKSTVTVNLATALASRGLNVGILDADVYGYSIPALMGLAPEGIPVRPTRLDDAILPPVSHGVKVISIGMFVDDASVAVAWRGPMLQRTVSQFLTDVYFGDLDVLLIDLPPGTGDVAITVGQLLPHADVLVVTTPQPYAAGVAVRAGGLAAQTGQRVIGVVENMTTNAGAEGETLSLFGAGGGEAVVAGLVKQGITADLVARIPLSPRLAESADSSIPLVIGNPDDAAAVALTNLATRVLELTRRAGRGVRLTPG